LVCAEGRYVEGNEDSATEKRAAIFIGPEFGTVSRPFIDTEYNEESFFVRHAYFLGANDPY
jgi:hypothetical protein